MRNPRDDACQQRSIAPSILWIVERTKAQTIERRNRPRAHCENIAQNSADAGGCALKRLDKRRMIVRFDLETRAPAIAQVDHAGVLAGRHDYALARRRQALEMNPRRLVGTMLRPHD